MNAARFGITSIILVLAGCQYLQEDLASLENQRPLSVRLTATQTGTLEYCDENNQCTERPNDLGCASMELTIFQRDGSVCETCFDQEGVQLSMACDAEATTECSVFKVSDPDCVVCAFVGGAVFYSTCIADEPTCRHYNKSYAGVTEASAMGSGTCQECTDIHGNTIVDECRNNCDTVLCIALACEPGFIPHQDSNSCCPTCIPDPKGVCAQVMCTQEGITSCPTGYIPTVNPNDCCSFICKPSEPATCDRVVAPSAMPSCAKGFHFERIPPTCGACVPNPVTEPPAGECTKNAECNHPLAAGVTGMYCTVSDGARLVGSTCPTGFGCGDYGVCQKSQCTPPYAPFHVCEGRLVSGGVDAMGCEKPPVCVCPGGTVTVDGTCGDLCSNVACFAPPPVCDPNTERLATAYPNCCGTCVPIDTTACIDTVGCSSTQASGSTTTNSDYSNTGCTDSDGGIVPNLKGSTSSWLSLTSPDGTATGQQDTGTDFCEGAGWLIEYSCQDPTQAKPKASVVQTLVQCPMGCLDGACK